MNENAEQLLGFAAAELKVLAEQGCETWELERRVELLKDSDSPDRCERARALCESLKDLKPSADFPYDEPSDLEAIRARRPSGPRHLAVALSGEQLDEATLGAWQGRVAGCMLGKPVEGWSRGKIGDLMKLCGLDALDDYLPTSALEAGGMGLGEDARPLLRGNITHAARDDDVDYTIIGLRVLEMHGRGFAPRHVADFWLAHLPFHRTYTAERAAYRNLVNGIEPPHSAVHRNPYREWIGAQIRADAFGYVCPGRPEEAADMAFRDACISHMKNGIYGEMWVAAMLAAAFVANRLDKVIEIGLSEIPQNCRLAEAVRQVTAWRSEGIEASEAMDRVLDVYGHYHGVHTINNAAIVALALLWGEKDFSRTVGLAVQAGLDTDCNGATAGSVVGTMIGAGRIPHHWTEPLADRVETAVCGLSGLTISGLAARTRKLQESARQAEPTGGLQTLTE